MEEEYLTPELVVPAGIPLNGRSRPDAVLQIFASDRIVADRQSPHQTSLSTSSPSSGYTLYPFHRLSVCSPMHISTGASCGTNSAWQRAPAANRPRRRLAARPRRASYSLTEEILKLAPIKTNLTVELLAQDINAACRSTRAKRKSRSAIMTPLTSPSVSSGWPSRSSIRCQLLRRRRPLFHQRSWADGGYRRALNEPKIAGAIMFAPSSTTSWRCRL